MRAKPLAGIRVLDLTRLLPGAMCTLHLGDMGAEVLKIEDPWQGGLCADHGCEEKNDVAAVCNYQSRQAQS